MPSAIPCGRIQGAAFSSALRNKYAASRRGGTPQARRWRHYLRRPKRLCPEAKLISIGTKPWLPAPRTVGGERTALPRTPQAAKTITSGTRKLGSASCSAAGWACAAAIIVREVMTSGLPVSSNASTTVIPRGGPPPRRPRCRPIVDQSRVDYAVADLSAAYQAIQIIERTATCLLECRLWSATQRYRRNFSPTPQAAISLVRISR